MKLILHHFWKDVRLMRWLLVLWLLIVTIQAVLAFLSVQPEPNRADVAAELGNSMLLYMMASITWALVIVRLIQSEPVKGAASFWLTRPVPPWVYVPSKLIFILGLAILPSLLMHWLGFELFDVQADAKHNMMTSLFVVDAVLTLVVIWLATYTRTLVQFWAVLSILVLLFVGWSALIFFQSRFESHADKNPNLMASRMELGTLLFFGGLIISLIIQYGFRRTRAAFVTGITGVTLSLLVAYVWPFPWPIFSFGGKRGADHSVQSAHIHYQMDPKNLVVTWQSNWLGTTDESAHLNITPPPPETKGFPAPDSVSWAFQPDGGKKIQMEDTFILGASYADGINLASILQKDNPGLAIIDSRHFSGDQSVGFQLPPDRAAQIKGKTGTLNLKIEGHFLTLVKRAEMPLRGTKFARIPNFILRITSIEHADSGMTLRVAIMGYTKMASDFSSLKMLLVDSKNQTGIVAEDMGSTWTQNNFFTGSEWNLASGSKKLGYNLNNLPADVQAKIRANTDDDWTLYVYEVTPTGPFDSEVAAPHFKL